MTHAKTRHTSGRKWRLAPFALHSFALRSFALRSFALRAPLASILLASILVTGTGRAESLAIITGEEATSIEKYAASELAGILERVFTDIDVQIISKASVSQYAIVLGSPKTNPITRKLMSDGWPQLSDQGIVIKSVERKGAQRLVVGGGSPRATLWAAYELGHQLGVRYLLRGDMYPNKRRPLDLTGHDVQWEPKLRVRTWRTINDFAMGPESWGIQEHRRVLKQLAKLKYNRLMLQVYPWQPFVDYEFGGVKKSSAMLWFGEKYPIDAETVGRKVFVGKSAFNNPDFENCDTPAAMMDAGRKLVRGITRSARELGIDVGISISPLEFPKEFQSALPGSRIGKGINRLTIVPTAAHRPTDETLRKLVATKIRAYIETYPQIDTLYLTLPEFPEWEQHSEQAWKLLQPRLGDATSLDKLIQDAQDRSTVVAGSRGVQAVKGNLVAFAFLHQLLADKMLLRRKDGSEMHLVITSPDPALMTHLESLYPKNASALHFVDYTARRVVENRHYLDRVPADRVSSQLILTLADDNVGVLPQSASNSLNELVDALKSKSWAGYSTRYWLPGELDPDIYFLSRAAWEDVSADAAITELWTTATGNASAADRLKLAQQHLERATNTIDENDLGFAFPVPGMMMKHFQGEPLPMWWEEVNDAYTQYMIELYRAQGAIEGDAKPILFYYAKRGEYVLEYLAAVKAVREAAIAQKSGDDEAALEQMEVALEQTYNCINTLSDVAIDQSDRGLIALLNAYAYRPLVAKYEEMADEAP
jgi:hypothetical protein